MKALINQSMKSMLLCHSP